MTPFPSMLQSGCIVGLLPVRISMDSMSISSIEAMGALPLQNNSIYLIADNAVVKTKTESYYRTVLKDADTDIYPEIL